MNRYIERVFIDDQYQYGGMLKKDLSEAKKTFYDNAVKVLAETGADHVVYCHIEYSEDGEIKSAHFYSRLPMDEKTFDERTRTIPGTDYIGAVQKKAVERRVPLMVVTNINIHKRTFEGVSDLTKSDNAITSKYYASNKYAVSYDMEGYEHNPIVRCFRTKKEAEQYVDELKGENK